MENLRLGLSLNVSKCQSMTFPRDRNSYQLFLLYNGIVLTFAVNLGLFSFTLLIEKSTLTTLRMRHWRFIKRISDELSLPSGKSRFLCISILEYRSVVVNWSPYTSLVCCHRIERVWRFSPLQPLNQACRVLSLGSPSVFLGTLNLHNLSDCHILLTNCPFSVK